MNLTDPLKKTSQTSYFQTFVASAFVGPALVMAWLWLAHRVLSPADADTFKTCLLGLWALLTGGSGGATLLGGLARTLGKIDLQKAQAQLLPASDLLSPALSIPDLDLAGGATDADNAG
ncbi:hypothetical protein IAD21_00666 [Abditibacteriota bacterium]|nr:hypothetical protein IAD21_00666 [Abditibacteriota bacterium]